MNYDEPSRSRGPETEDRPSDDGSHRSRPQHDPQDCERGSPPRNNRQFGRRPYRDPQAAQELSYDDVHVERDVNDDDEDGQVQEDEEERQAYLEKQQYDYDEDEYEYAQDRQHHRGHREGRKYLDLDRDGGTQRARFLRSPRRRRSRSRSPKGQGRPVDTIIIEGIPESVTLNDLRTSFYACTDLVDFPTAQIRVPSGPRAYIQFQSLSDSIKWMEANFPRITLEFPGRVDIPKEKLSCFIHYARNPSKSNGHKEDSSGYQHMVDNAWRSQLTGATDVSQTPSQILVFYPLAPSIDEEQFAMGVKQLEKDDKSNKPRGEGAAKLKSTAPVGDTTGLGAKKDSLHRVFLIRDTATNVSLNYGFAEFWTLEDSMAAIAKFTKSRTFNIGLAPVMVSTIHLGVFVPETREVIPQIEKQSFHPLLNPTIRVRYRDLHVYPSIRIVTEEPPRGTILASHQPNDVADEAKKVKKRKGDLLASGPAKKPVMMVGQMAMWQKKHAEIIEPGPDDNPVKSSANSIPVTSRNGPIKISLGGGLGKGLDGGNTTELSGTSSQSAPSVAGSDDIFVPSSYIDREKLQCLLCMMKYKSLDDCNVHERSRNHKTAMKDATKVAAAVTHLTARAKKTATATSESQYRDRAKERRNAFNQPEKPKGPASKDTKAKPIIVERRTSPVRPKNTVATGKGSSLLAKMGWTKGTGLGANGEGRTEIIETKAYQEGFGLGAEGGELGDASVVAERKTVGKFDYVGTVQDKARERYKQLDSQSSGQ